MLLRVLSYNIWEGGGNRLSVLVDIIHRQHPDAVALMEANSRANAIALARNLEMDLVFGEANSECHIAWLSRLPILRSENHRLTTLSKTLLEIEVTWDGIPLRLFATHLASRHDSQQPAEEIRAILHVLARLENRPHLLVGDLNALQPGDPIGAPPTGTVKRGDAADGARRDAIRLILEAGYVDCYRTLHPQAPGHTYPTVAPWLRLDYIFASPQSAPRLYACDFVAGEAAAQASDHFPIWADFR
jgi:exodeoxyribonuclease III